jgi:hypothetical protein
MAKPNHWIVKAAIFLLSYSCVSSQLAWAQAPPTPDKTPELYFSTNPTKQLFSLGEDVVIVLELYSRSEQPILVSLQGDEFVSFKVAGPDGRDVPWRVRASSKGLSASDLTVIEQYTQVTAKKILSLKDGTGFVFDKPGQYSLTAEFSMGPPEKFDAFVGQAKPAVGAFHSTKLAFCIEACILEPLPARDNAPRSALDAVHLFYTYITRYRQFGPPYGRAKKALQPLMSKRLALELDNVGACDKDYYRRYGEVLRANTWKPATPWLEEGLFTGPDEAATPHAFRIVGSRAIGDHRVDVQLRFTTKQTYSSDFGIPPSYEHYEGVVTAILENNRWVIDDYVAMFSNDELRRLSAGYSECKGGQWVGQPTY